VLALDNEEALTGHSKRSDEYEEFNAMHTEDKAEGPLKE
jgi:hypothetical protein